MRGRALNRVVIVGGGLAGSLLAYRLHALRPDLGLTLLERDARLGGRHTWSFHEADLAPVEREWIAPLVVSSWRGQEVRFPNRVRRLDASYHSIDSNRLHDVVAAALGPRLWCETGVTRLQADGVTLAPGRDLAASCVIDARGASEFPGLVLGWQKFLGRRLRLPRPHGLRAPILMDATVEQRDGFRFFYVLPWSDHELLVEDTRYSDEPGIERSEMRTAIEGYAAARGWRDAQVLGEEEGALPIPLDGDVEELLESGPRDVPVIGMRAGLFHFTTGYSLPHAVRLADALAARLPAGSAELAVFTRESARRHWRQGAYFRLLNRLLFRAAHPHERYRVLERFYGLPQPLIARFYAGALTATDRVRVLAGRPPVPLLRAARVLLGGGARP